MTLSLSSNISSLSAQRQLQRTSNSLGKVFERLSSGLRINTASDDPAGLQMADKLRAQSRIAGVAIRNANDGLSFTAIADSALDQIGGMLTRMAELAEQSANGVYTNTQRSAMSAEFLALGSEVERVAKTTEFNGLKLLSNSQNITLQVGLDSSANSKITVNKVDGTLYGLGLATIGSSQLTYSIISISEEGSQDAATNALDAVKDALDNLGAKRGTLGAAESRLNTAINYLTVARENYIAAESRIRDADVAMEVAEKVRLQVLQQAGAAVLAQANLQPELVLNLLK